MGQYICLFKRLLHDNYSCLFLLKSTLLAFGIGPTLNWCYLEDNKARYRNLKVRLSISGQVNKGQCPMLLVMMAIKDNSRVFLYIVK